MSDPDRLAAIRSGLQGKRRGFGYSWPCEVDCGGCAPCDIFWLLAEAERLTTELSRTVALGESVIAAEARAVHELESEVEAWKQVAEQRGAMLVGTIAEVERFRTAHADMARKAAAQLAENGQLRTAIRTHRDGCLDPMSAGPWNWSLWAVLDQNTPDPEPSA